ncbi:MAG: hypothetical protein H6621_08880 [Halobacteriovoraceae bacterium]|nr:hypothetical protein [Halobacteriovoraceae bacterium]MCB9095167.1 hypothetical protein [Halobacteriovoraceae bacterium]
MKLNILTNRVEKFEKCLKTSKFELLFNESPDSNEYNLIDFENCPEFDDSFLVTKCAYFSDLLKGINRSSFSRIKPDYYICSTFDELPFRVDDFLKFSSEKFKIDGSKVFESTINGSAEYRKLVSKFFADYKFHSQIFGDRARLVADEIISNSIYNSPVDESGNPLFRYVDRSEEVKLDEGKEILVKFIESDNAFVIQCKDSYGSLLSETVKNYLYKEIIKPEKRGGGAGIGISVVFQNSNAIFYNIELNSSTEVTVLLRKFKQNKDFEISSREVFINQDGDL